MVFELHKQADMLELSVTAEEINLVQHVVNPSTISINKTWGKIPLLKVGKLRFCIWFKVTNNSFHSIPLCLNIPINLRLRAWVCIKFCR